MSLRATSDQVARRLAKRFNHVELRQLRILQRAFDSGSGPDVLVFGDSMMFWTAPDDQDHTLVADMIAEELGPDVRVCSIVGPGYNPRIVMAFLAALGASRSRPRVVVVPVSTVFASLCWLAHPVFGYEEVAAAIRRAVSTGSSWRLRVDPPDQARWDQYDAMPAPSLAGDQRTIGELRMVAETRPTSGWQRTFRLRLLTEYYFAERVDPQGPGIELVGELGKALLDLDLASVGYIAPLNHEAGSRLLGTDTTEHLRSNGEIVARAFGDAVGSAGVAFDAVVALGEDAFFDPAHLRAPGRRHMAKMIADAARTNL
jgi:hypothetical protein